MKFKRKLMATLLSVAMLASVMTTGFTSAAAEETSDTEKVEFVRGDADKDGEVKMADVVMVQKQIAKLVEFDEAQTEAADVEAPFGEITMLDVTCTQKYIAKLITEFPADSKTSDSDTTDTTDTTSDTTTDVSSDTTDTTTDVSSDTTDTTTDSTSDVNTDSEEERDWLTLVEANAAGENAAITLRGQVTYIYGSNTIILEEVNDGVVESFQIYDYQGVSDGKYPLNAVVEVSGTTSTYNSVLQISSPSEVSTISEGNAPIAAVEATVATIGDYLATFIVIRDCTVTTVDSQNATVKDATGSANIYKPAALPEEYTEGDTMDLLCAPYLYNNAAQLRVANTSDYCLDGYTAPEPEDSDDDSAMADALVQLDLLIEEIKSWGDETNDNGYYVASSYAPFSAKYQEAVKVSADQTGYTAAQVEALTEELSNLWNVLEYTTLGEIWLTVYSIDYYQDNENGGFYTDESYDPFFALYEQANKLLNKEITLTDAEAEKLLEDLTKAWDSLVYTAYGDLYFVYYDIVNAGLESNEDGIYEEESYATFYALFEQVTAYLKDTSTLTEEQARKLCDDIIAAANSLEYTEEGILYTIEYYVEGFAEIYDSIKAEAYYADWVEGYEALEALLADHSEYTVEQMTDMFNDFIELSDNLGMFS